MTQMVEATHDETKCDHYWSYEHMLWQARDNSDDEIAVGRYCSKCGKLETAIASHWRALPKSYVDMRETLQRSANSTRE
jgi:hypothetical protein